MRIGQGKEVFAHGDRLVAKLGILQKYDSEADAYRDSKYTVEKVLRHVKRDLELFSEGDGK